MTLPIIEDALQHRALLYDRAGEQHYDLISALLAGAHIITIPPEFIGKIADHKYTRETVRQFINDAQKALTMMEQAK
ncbi:MAG: hypothetical protein NTX46_05845 [Chloroflexi bacterium]|nr:hypothetical protein [Chloroflexota bacterium]